MRDGVRPSVVCTLPSSMGSGLSAGRRERQGQPAALPLLERDDPYGSASTYICVGPRFREQIPCTLASLMASTLEPRAPNHPRNLSEGPPRTRALPTNRAEFQVFAGGGEQRRWASSAPTRPAQRCYHHLGSGSVLPTQRCHHLPGIGCPRSCTQYTKRPGPLPVEPIRSRPWLGLLHQSPACSKDEFTLIYWHVC